MNPNAIVNSSDINEEDSYVLREYFRHFFPNQSELMHIKERIIKVNRENFLSYIISQNKKIYNAIATNYNTTNNIIASISETINSFNSIKPKASSNKSHIQDYHSMYDIKYDMDDPLQNITIANISGHYYHNEPIAITNLKDIISHNENILQQSSNEIIARTNTIIKTKQRLSQTQTILQDELKDKEFLIDNLDDSDTTITISIAPYQVNLLLIFFNDCLKESLLREDSSAEEAKLLCLQKMNRINKKEMKKRMMVLDNAFYENFDKNSRRVIQSKLSKLKEEIYDGNDCQNFFYNLYNCLKCLMDIADWRTEVEEYKEVIRKSEKVVNEMKGRIKEIGRKNEIWKLAIDEVERKYKMKFGAKIMKMKEMDYDDEIGVYIDNRGNEVDCTGFDELKMMIAQMEDNYVGLLKKLSKMIIKPKSVTRMRDKNINNK